MDVAALDVRDLNYSYPDSGAGLHEISFSIAAGERVALLGPNGSGKSTLLWCLVGVLHGQGRIAVADIELREGTEADVRRKLGLAFSEPDDQLFMPTVRRDVIFGLRAAGDSPEDAERKALAATDRVGLNRNLLDRPPYELSSGERRRAALAGILALSPVLIALDEPTNSLDARGTWSLMQTLAGLDCAQLIATHDLAFAQSVCRRAIVLLNGRLVADAPIQELASDRPRLVEYGLALPTEIDDEEARVLR